MNGVKLTQCSCTKSVC